MPGMQGGAFMHEIAAKGLACSYAMTPEFVSYQKQVIVNAQAMAHFFMSKNYTVISAGTDTHLFVIDVRPLGLTGKDAEQLLESAEIYVNRNVIPFDTLPALTAGGIRIGTAAITTRGAQINHVIEIAHIIDELFVSRDVSKAYAKVRSVVYDLESVVKIQDW